MRFRKNKPSNSNTPNGIVCQTVRPRAHLQGNDHEDHDMRRGLLNQAYPGSPDKETPHLLWVL